MFTSNWSNYILIPAPYYCEVNDELDKVMFLISDCISIALDDRSLFYSFFIACIEYFHSALPIEHTLYLKELS